MDAKKAAEQIAALREVLKRQKRELQEIADANEKLRDEMDLPPHKPLNDGHEEIDPGAK
jgi:hypothetical protein